ncbi:hypothetical protein ZEAMMB73_Zm00001d048299 [Zea mays]|nr:hypothetical protein ZEAMMB73_Zm00001d048299 [Zea mays]
MVGGGVGRPVTDTQEEHSSDPVNPSYLMEKVAPDETVKEEARQETAKKSPSPM